jgi:hypothetical protein
MRNQRKRLWGTDGHEGRFYRFTAALFGPASTGPYEAATPPPAPTPRNRWGRPLKGA